MKNVPTERFYRLPKEKKRTILEAAKKEFARVPYEKASINQIIHNADISRGSFYTYFEDKQDVLRYLLEEEKDEVENVCRKALEENHGDYLKMLECLFEHFVMMLQSTKETLEMARNVFSHQENAKLIGIGEFPNPKTGVCEEGPILWIWDKVDQTRMRWGDVTHFKALVTLGISALMISVKQYYEYPESLELVRENYHMTLDMLRYGAYQEKVKN